MSYHPMETTSTPSTFPAAAPNAIPQDPIAHWASILSGDTPPADDDEARFLEFRFPTEHPSTLLRRIM